VLPGRPPCRHVGAAPGVLHSAPPLSVCMCVLLTVAHSRTDSGLLCCWLLDIRPLDHPPPCADICPWFTVGACGRLMNSTQLQFNNCRPCCARVEN